MAKVIFELGIEGMSGRVGDVVFRRQGKQTIMYSCPRRSTKPPTAAQVATRDRFREATQWAKAALSDPGQRQYYEELAGRRRKPVFSITLREMMAKLAADPP